MIAVNTKFSFNFRQQFCFDIKFEFMLKNSKHKSHFSNFLKKNLSHDCTPKYCFSEKDKINQMNPAS